MEDFGAGNFPVILATMALGLGQNLKRVQCVIHMGRADPASIVQMVGRCGCNGKTGPGILFMEPTRKTGFNNLDDFKEGVVQTNDVRMDALAVTNLCLRVALTVDNKLVAIEISPGSLETDGILL
jgi:superfamily II DNA helicase RecQ